MKIGILGGGQLAQMMLQTEIAQQHEFLIYSSAEATPTKDLAKQIIAPYDDFPQLETFAHEVDVVTYETETIPVATVNFLEQFTAIFPNQKALATFQDRLLEKDFFNELAVPTNRYFAIEDESKLTIALLDFGFPFIIKARRDGYDGKYQWRVRNREQLEKIIKTETLRNCIVEEFVNFDREVSIVAVRAKSGEMKFYPLCENVHKNGILHHTIVKPHDSLQAIAEQYCRIAAEALDYVGVMAIEFFVKDNQLYVNEAAPRVHNSGHWTIEGAPTSQFSNHLRAILGLEILETKQENYALMYNFIGDLANKTIIDKLDMQFHDYHKTARSGRKLAHSTLATTDESVFQDALETIENLLHEKK